MEEKSLLTITVDELSGVIEQVMQQELTAVNHRLDVMEKDILVLKKKVTVIKQHLDFTENDILALKKKDNCLYEKFKNNF